MSLYCLKWLVYPKELVKPMMLHLKLMKLDLKDSEIKLKIKQQLLVRLRQQLKRLHRSNLKTLRYYRYLVELKKLCFISCQITRKWKCLNFKDLLY